LRRRSHQWLELASRVGFERRKAVLKLMFGAMIRAAERWRAIKVTDFERRQMVAVRQELDRAYETRNGLATKAVNADHAKLSSTSRT